MNIFAKRLDVILDTARFAKDEETLKVAIVVTRYAEKCRAAYRNTEEPITLGPHGIEGYWSETVPWYEWMSEPEVLQSCADECGLKIWQLADQIAYQIRPSNWQVFSWMGMALQGSEYEKEHFSDSLSQYALAFKTMLEKRHKQAIEAGRASGKSRREGAKVTSAEVEKGYQIRMATGTEERNIAAILAKQFDVTPDHVRKLRKVFFKKPQSKRD